jgi:SAM-dependent methyltransferase/predicted metal-dependent enzyme (double-stranded beta helix superfamily)
LTETPNLTLELLPLPLQRIVTYVHRNSPLKPADLRKAVLESGVTENDIMPWADYDHPVGDSYGRKLVYKEDNLEIMVMSWRPGDFSALHDHGYTEYGAVKVFGHAEHAAFHVEEDTIRTLSRWMLQPGETISVSHSLVHQMGNPGEAPFLSLHVYGTPVPQENITGAARVFDLQNQVIQRVDGGVFFALPPDAVLRTEPGPEPDFPTYLRYMIELYRRLQKIAAAGNEDAAAQANLVLSDMQSPKHRARLLRCLLERTDKNGHSTDSVYWKILNHELIELAALQRGINEAVTDSFNRYAKLYDAVIGQSCLNDFMADYLHFFGKRVNFSWSTARIFSLGCGTGLVEARMISEFGVQRSQVLGLDISAAMLSLARERIPVIQGDFLKYQGDLESWDLVFCGLNGIQYFDHHRFDEGIHKIASLLRPGAWFLGDFITPDHIRWYPNVLYSADSGVVSLRTPQFVEADGALFQESEIINIDFSSEKMDVSYSGRHLRFLPSLDRVRRTFEVAFKGEVLLFDAVNRSPIGRDAESCASTRYVVMAQKA